MDLAIRTIVGIVRLRTSSRTRRPIRPQSTGQPQQRPATPAPAPAPSGGRRIATTRRSAVLVAIVLACVAGIATTLVLTTPRLSEVEPLRLTNDSTPTVELRIAHPAGVSAADVRVSIDGEAIDPDRIHVASGGEQIRVRIPRQRDGRHQAKVVVAGAGLLHRTLDVDWTFVVDTAPPASRVVAPTPAEDGDSAYVAAGVAAVTKAPLRLTVAAEPDTTIDVSSNARGAETTHAEASSDARRTISVPLPQGEQRLAIVTTDQAGNETRRALRVLVDTIGPRVTMRAPRIVRDNTLALPIGAHDPHGVELRVLLDGNELEDVLDTIASTPPPNTVDEASTPTEDEDPAPSADDDRDDGDDGGSDQGDETTEPAPIAGRWKLAVADGALEGRHTLEVIATDSLGTRTKLTRRVLVDSTEELGEAEGLRGGAHGRDVSQLHQALLEQEIVGRTALAQDLRTRTYGAQTTAAIQRFQRQRGIDADGIAGGETIAALTLKIVVDRGANTLTLYRVGKVVKTWGVATGSSEYPTPSGEFEIQTMQENPTWTPPDSAWAKDAEVIPPGPDNPLGTRWMAINGTVGIHGTNNPASIGYSVSHGCIRMAIPDVEELYAMVEIGTPVTVV
jgi:lipoprotein-anchoring transpeptidase ErfK/SrfK